MSLRLWRDKVRKKGELSDITISEKTGHSVGHVRNILRGFRLTNETSQAEFARQIAPFAQGDSAAFLEALARGAPPEELQEIVDRIEKGPENPQLEESQNPSQGTDSVESAHIPLRKSSLTALDDSRRIFVIKRTLESAMEAAFKRIAVPGFDPHYSLIQACQLAFGEPFRVVEQRESPRLMINVFAAALEREDDLEKRQSLANSMAWLFVEGQRIQKLHRSLFPDTFSSAPQHYKAFLEQLIGRHVEAF